MNEQENRAYALVCMVSLQVVLANQTVDITDGEGVTLSR
jgi:hypothetical protein